MNRNGSAVPKVQLSDGRSMPQLGFGVFQVPPEETEAAVSAALEIGYRSIDTASLYANEAEVGKAIAKSGLAREDLFITTKLWNSDQGYESTLRAFEASAERLGLESVDLYLIHWPCPARDLYVETWRAFEELKADGKATSIGVSNFRISDLERLGRSSETAPVINQIELHPLLGQPELRDYHHQNGIATEAWSPLAQTLILGHPTLVGIADELGRSVAQVVLRWHLQLGNVVIPKTVTPARMAENLDVFDFELSRQQMDAITALDEGTRIGPDPSTFNR